MRKQIAIAATAVTLCAGLMSASSPEPQGAKPAGIPTYTKDVAPILYKHCTTCHRPGEIAPMSLLTYDDVRPHAKDIRDEVGDGNMPPWHADPKYRKFANDRSLTAAERDTLLRWVNNGSPKGDPKDLPPLPEYTEGWQLGQPDLVLAMPVEYKVPADGFVEYEYFEIPTNFTEDKWVQAVEVRPGNRSVVHHVILSARAPKPDPRPGGVKLGAGMEIPAGQTGGPAEQGEQKRPRGQALFPRPRGAGAMLGGFAPGTSSMKFEPGAAVLIRAGSTIVMQMHYTPNGEAATDRTRIGFTFAKEPPDREMRLSALVNGTLHIPAGDPDYSIAAEMTTTSDITIRQMLPHTHLRGKSWEYTVTYPDGRSEVVLAVPKYDFNWQTDYVFAEPLKLPKGTKLRAVAHYDNSAKNKANPDPKADVWWGDQTWEEMMFTSFVYSIDGVKPGAVLTLPQRGSGGGQ
jgi:mono/diheme cytochrome c family protein